MIQNVKQEEGKETPEAEETRSSRHVMPYRVLKRVREEFRDWMVRFLEQRSGQDKRDQMEDRTRDIRSKQRAALGDASTVF